MHDDSKKSEDVPVGHEHSLRATSARCVDNEAVLKPLQARAGNSDFVSLTRPGFEHG